MSFGIYVHYPYCKRICPYCDYSVETARMRGDDTYTTALLKEFDLRYPDYESSGNLATLYFGGGTPSLWSVKQLARFYHHVMERCTQASGLEVTIEVNPEDASLAYLSSLFELGINRLSIGAQSLDNQVLRGLGRGHNREDVLACIETCKRAGFTNWNVDLLHGLQGQTLASVVDDVVQVIALGTPHLSTYQLTIEAGTPFALREQKGAPLTVADGLLTDMYEGVELATAQNGLEHYEISNAARAGFESQHNLGYWNGNTFMGLGAGAHGLYQQGQMHVRYSNRAGVDSYLSALSQGTSADVIASDTEVLDSLRFAEDLLLTGLRMTRGVVPSETMREQYGDKVTALKASNLMRTVKGRWCTTDEGRMLLDYVLRRLLT